MEMIVMEVREKISPGYKSGSATKEMAATLSDELFALLREKATPKMLELLYLRDSMQSIALGLSEQDCLADPLGDIAQVLQFLDGINEESPESAPEPAKE